MKHLLIILSILILANPLIAFEEWGPSLGKIPNLECSVIQTSYIDGTGVGKFRIENYDENWSDKKYFIKNGDLSISSGSRKYRYGEIFYNEMGDYYNSGIEYSGLYYLYFVDDYEKGRFVHLDKYQVVVFRVSCRDL